MELKGHGCPKLRGRQAGRVRRGLRPAPWLWGPRLGAEKRGWSQGPFFYQFPNNAVLKKLQITFIRKIQLRIGFLWQSWVLGKLKVQQRCQFDGLNG